MEEGRSDTNCLPIYSLNSLDCLSQQYINSIKYKFKPAAFSLKQQKYFATMHPTKDKLEGKSTSAFSFGARFLVTHPVVPLEYPRRMQAVL